MQLQPSLLLCLGRFLRPQQCVLTHSHAGERRSDGEREGESEHLDDITEIPAAGALIILLPLSVSSRRWPVEGAVREECAVFPGRVLLGRTCRFVCRENRTWSVSEV